MISIIQDTNYPAYKPQPGFKGALLLTDPSTGKAISMTLWDTEANLRASEAGSQERRLSVAATLNHPPRVEYYYVGIRVVPSSEGSQASYAWFVPAQIQPGRMLEAINAYREMLPSVTKQPGSLAIIVLTNPSMSKAVAIGLWETEAGMERDEAGGEFQKRADKLEHLLTQPRVFERYQVGAQAWAVSR